MCGIVGLFFKDDQFNPRLGEFLAPMLISMTDRGPDSAGFAIYGDGHGEDIKITVHAPNGAASVDFYIGRLEREISADISVTHHNNHTVVAVPKDVAAKVVSWLSEHAPDLHVMSVGSRMEIYKDVGQPGEIAKRYGLASMRGTHAIGHTRMATELAVVTNGAHPYSTGIDQCLVHNGSLSNHNSLRRQLAHDGFNFDTENDTEVAAAYLSWRMRQGLNSARRSRPRWRTSTGSTHSWSVPRAASVCCAILSRASTRSWRKPNPMWRSAPNIGRWSSFPGSTGRGFGNPIRRRSISGSVVSESCRP